MERILKLRSADLAAERLPVADEDVHFPRALVHSLISEFSAPGDSVLDPFAGFGTTIAIASELGRTAIGIELLPDRAEAIRQRIGPADRVVVGDSRHLDDLGIGPVDLCITSPPYMTARGHPENPLDGYRTLGADYGRYLAELTDVFRMVTTLLRPGGYLAINAANIWSTGAVTPLAWDIGLRVAALLPFHGEIYLDWDEPPEYITGDYCLVYRKTPERVGNT